jgi:hypothetical protein
MVKYNESIEGGNNMKVFRDEKVYVQLKDLSLLFKNGGYLIPQSVFKKSLKKALDMKDENRDEFIMFDTPEELNLFRNIDFIVDFDDIRSMDQDEYDLYMMSLRYNAESLQDKISDTNRYFHKLDLNDKYKKEMHKIVGSREARRTRRNAVNKKINGEVKKKIRFPFFKRRNK